MCLYGIEWTSFSSHFCQNCKPHDFTHKFGGICTLFQEGNLKRYPTPYPDELKNMVKTAQSVAHRLKEDESSDESGRDAKPIERNHIGVQDVGVKVSFG